MKRFYIPRRKNSKTAPQAKPLGEKGERHVRVPPRYSMAMAIGYLESKRAIRIYRQLVKKKGTLFGRSLWTRGYCASPVGFDEWYLKAYIKEHEQLQEEQKRLVIDFDL